MKLPVSENLMNLSQPNELLKGRERKRISCFLTYDWSSLFIKAKSFHLIISFNFTFMYFARKGYAM